MPRLRTVAPWLLALLALAGLAAPHVPKDIFTPARLAAVAAGLVLVTLLVALWRRRRARPRPPTPPKVLAARAARDALARSLDAARRHLGGRPARVWLVLGPAGHADALLHAGLGPLRDLTDPALVAGPRVLAAEDPADGRLVLAHPPVDCDWSPLRRLRPRQPVDALVLAVDLPALLAAAPDLEALRAQLVAALDGLALDVPVHLACARLDRVAGHAELAGDDDAAWALALAGASELPAALRRWSRWVDAQRLARLAAEPDPERRARLFTFAASFARACRRLGELAAAVLADHRGAPLRLRSLCFAADRPAAAPPDLLLQRLADRLHLPLRAHRPVPSASSHVPGDIPSRRPADLLAPVPEDSSHVPGDIPSRRPADLLAPVPSASSHVPGDILPRRPADLLAPVPEDIPPEDPSFAGPRTISPRARRPLARPVAPALALPAAPGALLAALERHADGAARAPAHRRRAALRAHAAALGLGLAAALLLEAAPGVATDQHARLRAAADRAAALAADAPARPDDALPATAARQADLLALQAELATWRDPPAGPLARLLAPDLAADLRRVYRRAVREHVLRGLWAGLARTLDDFAARPAVAADERLAARDRLRGYLLLTADLSEAPGPMDPVQKDWLADDLPRRWATDVRPDADAAAISPVLAAFFADAAAEDFGFPRDHALVQRVRARLEDLAADDAALQSALAAVDAECPALGLAALTHAEQLRADRELPCSFTRPGWDRVQRRLAAAVDHHDGWILGRPAQGLADSRAQRLARLRERYDARYVQAWSDFLAGLRVRRPTDLAGAARLLAELTADDRPLVRVFAGLDAHTRGLGARHADLPAWLPAHAQGVAAEVHTAFAPLLGFTVADGRETGLSRWHARLVELQAALEAARADPALLPELRAQADAALADTHALLRQADLRRFRPLLTALLVPPLEALQAVVRDQDKLSLVRTYCRELHGPLARLAARYPLARGARDDAAPGDLVAVFHPETGAAARVRAQLAPWLLVHGAEVRARPAPRSDPHPLTPAALALFARAARVGALAFPGGELRLDLDVDLRCNPDIGRVTFTLDGQVHTYACGPDARARMRWPGGGDGEPGAGLDLLGRDGRRQQLPGRGPWGLWRLLERDGVVTLPDDPARDPLVFRFDLRAARLGTLELGLTPTRVDGATLLLARPAPGRPPELLAPLRAPELLDPPSTLFVGLPACADLPPTP